MLTNCERCGNPLATEALDSHVDGCDCAECRAHCWSEYGGDCPEPAPTPHPLDAAAEILRGLAVAYPSRVCVTLDVYPSGAVILQYGGARYAMKHGEAQAHLTDRTLPLPSEALARLVKP